MSRFLLFLALCVLLPTCVAVEPRAVAGRVADTIEREYFDPAQARAIADGLRNAARQGELDGLAHPQELATALTTRLRPHDRHFNVRWREPGAEASAVSPARAAGVPGGPRDNFGIRQVQRLPGNLGHLDLRVFADFDFDPPQAPARQAIDAALQLLAHTDALLIDLRDNGGGSPAMVGYLASAFLPQGRDVYNRFHARDGVESEAPATPYPHPRTALPLYVLVSGRTGSAAEAFAYTLQQAGRAQIVGEATGGAANPGRPFDAGEGFSVFVSTGTPRNPVSGSNWEGTGVRPDVATASADALDAATRLALGALLARGEGQEARWALEALDAVDNTVRTELVDMLAGDYGAVRVEAEGATLQLRQGRRPALRLRPLSDTLYYVEGDPARRVRFERDGARVRALELLWANGQLARHLRTEAPPART